MIHLALFVMLQQAAVVAPAAGPAAQAGGGNELLEVRSVYILPMGSGLDQYVANRLTRSGVLQVVTDPAKADAILSDRIGKALETKLEELYPDPAKLAAAEALERKKKDAHKDDEEGEERTMQIRTNPLERNSTFGRAKGTLFLVHRGSRNVIWSAYLLPKSTRPDDLDEVAAEAAKGLGNAIGKEAKAGGLGAGERRWRPW